jgi:uncharacterized protein YjbI with pentapeptide repeats
LTYLVLNWLLNQRDKAEQQRRDEQEREVKRLEAQINAIAELKTADTHVKREAIWERMRLLDLFRGAFIPPGISFEHAFLGFADMRRVHLLGLNLNDTSFLQTDLSDARLEGAQMQNTDLEAANLEGAVLDGATMIRARFSSANLRCARIRRANLNFAVLAYAHLDHADLTGTLLYNTDFTESNLEAAILPGSLQFNEYTILPDGNRWTPDTDMVKFTDPKHPQFKRYVEPYQHWSVQHLTHSTS